MVVPLLVVCKEQQSACDNVRPVVQKTHEFGIVHIICKVGLAWWNCITGMPCRNTLQQKRGHFEKMLAIGRMNVILCEAAQIWTKSWCPRLSEASLSAPKRVCCNIIPIVQLAEFGEPWGCCTIEWPTSPDQLEIFMRRSLLCMLSFPIQNVKNWLSFGITVIAVTLVVKQ